MPTPFENIRSISCLCGLFGPPQDSKSVALALEEQIQRHSGTGSTNEEVIMISGMRTSEVTNTGITTEDSESGSTTTLIDSSSTQRNATQNSGTTTTLIDTSSTQRNATQNQVNGTLTQIEEQVIRNSTISQDGTESNISTTSFSNNVPVPDHYTGSVIKLEHKDHFCGTDALNSSISESNKKETNTETIITEESKTSSSRKNFEEKMRKNSFQDDYKKHTSVGMNFEETRNQTATAPPPRPPAPSTFETGECTPPPRPPSPQGM